MLRLVTGCAAALSLLAAHPVGAATSLGCVQLVDPAGDQSLGNQGVSEGLGPGALDVLSARVFERRLGEGWTVEIQLADLVRPVAGQQHYHHLRFSLLDHPHSATIAVAPLGQPPNTLLTDSFSVGPEDGSDGRLTAHYVTGSVDEAQDRLTLTFAPADVGLKTFKRQPLTDLRVQNQLVTGRTVGLVSDEAVFNRPAVAGRDGCP